MNSSKAANPEQAILELTVNNHPGVMSHVCGLFSRRAYNVDGILCMPIPNTDTSRIWLRVLEGDRLAQVEHQLHKLHDVHDVRRHPPDHVVFGNLQGFFQD
ncbi:MAG: acetolactate synthase small subunit [Candidatus Thiodiazotropha sp.]